MRAAIFRLVVAVLAIFSLIHTAQARGKFTTQYKYYSVSGSNAASLHANSTVPRGFFGSEKAYADISMKPDFKGTIYQRKRCRLKDFGINANFVIRLPKLRPGTRISKSLHRKFSGFVSFVKRHELIHRRIWGRCVKSTERRIRSLRLKSCDTFGKKAAKIISQEWSRCHKANARFDASERARLRRQPLVRAAFKPAKPKKTRRKTRRGASRTRTNFN
jgi:predicted secreted Zn-dependent protease